MGYILYFKKELGTPHKLKWYASLKGAKIGLKAANRNAGRESYAIMEENEFDTTYNGWTTTKSLMTGETIAIRAQDVGTCVDPGTERYWSM